MGEASTSQAGRGRAMVLAFAVVLLGLAVLQLLMPLHAGVGPPAWDQHLDCGSLLASEKIRTFPNLGSSINPSPGSVSRVTTNPCEHRRALGWQVFTGLTVVGITSLALGALMGPVVDDGADDEGDESGEVAEGVRRPVPESPSPAAPVLGRFDVDRPT